MPNTTITHDVTIETHYGDEGYVYRAWCPGCGWTGDDYHRNPDAAQDDASDHLAAASCTCITAPYDADHKCTNPGRPIDADLGAMAAWVVSLDNERDLLGGAARPVLTAWAVLIGLDHDRDAAVEVARRIVAAGELHAYTTPF